MTTTPPPFPPPPSSAPPRQLVRSRAHRLIAGVAGGAGEYLGIDPVIVRLLFVVLALAGGFGVLLYLAAWLIVPEAAVGADEPESPPRRAGHTALAVGVLALLVLLGGIGHVGWGVGFDGQLVWPLVLIGIGAAVLWTRGETAPAPLAPAAGSARTATGGRGDAAPFGPGPAVTPTVTPATTEVAPPPAPARNRSLLRRAAPVVGRALLVVVLGGVALVASVLVVVLLEGATALDVTAFEAIVTAGVAIGLAVWLGLRFHRLPELVACALAITLVAGVAAWLEPPLHGGYGTRDIRPEQAAALHRDYQLAGGRLRLDLSKLTVHPGVTNLSARLGAGLLQVVVPRDTTVVLDGHAGAGAICAFGRRDSGMGVDRAATKPRGPRTLRIVADVGAGAIVVARTRLGLQNACG